MSPSERPLPQLLTRGYAALLAALWAVLAWPALRDTFTTAPGRWTLLSFAVGLGLGLGVAPLARGAHRALTGLPRALWLALIVASSSAITAWLWFGPMNGQVISSDGCVYLLQGRAASHGALGVPLHAPRLAFAAKFLLEGLDGRLHSVFVPGYPIFLAPFVALGVPWLSGLVVGGALTVAQQRLGELVSDDAFAPRLSLLLLLPSFARGIETADLMSHAFVGALDVIAVILALRARERPRASLLAGLGACVGWVFAARMLDGFVLAGVCGLALASPLLRRKVPARAVAVALLCFAPFVAVVAKQQHACTGSWRRACVLDYVARGDHPPTCLKLGFGRDVGCSIEHARERASFGEDGYTPDDALRLMRERTGRLSAETLGFALLALVALLGVARDPTPAALLCASFPAALTLAYAFFYYGNSIVHGARHVFPAAPFLAVLAARALSSPPSGLRARLDDARWRGAVALATVAMFPAAHAGFWAVGLAEVHGLQARRVPVRRRIEEAGLRRGVFVLPDLHSYLADLDPWRDGRERVYVHDDRAGVLDVRRFFPDLPVHLQDANGRFLRVGSAPPPPGLDLEFERAWPTFQRPSNCGAMILHTMDCCGVPTRGGRALLVFAARAGARLEVPFDLARAGRYDLRLEGYGAFDHGRWQIAVDDQPLGVWEGYAATIAPRVLSSSTPFALRAGAHRFVATCLGRDPRSRDHHALFDALRATLAP
ncbi:MAG: hypothetical protein R3A48_06530 [Polyangiales bacterium]